MSQPECLRIAWWNTSLSPPGGSDPNSEGRWSVACDVVKSLILGAGVDVLALGEVTPDDVERLRKGIGEREFWMVADDRSAARRADLGLIYNSAKLKVASRPDPVSDSFLREPSIAAWGIEFITLADDGRLWVFSTHWRSQRRKAGEFRRVEAARSLREFIARLRKTNGLRLALVLGDFNDEPDSDSVERHLRASRDRAMACGRSRPDPEPDMLYNPSWRLLGERTPHVPGEICRTVAGTHYFRDSEPTTDWYTFDQIIVTPELVGNGTWNLLEESLRVWWKDDLFTPGGGLVKKFDHLPIVATIQRVHKESEGGGA